MSSPLRPLDPALLDEVVTEVIESMAFVCAIPGEPLDLQAPRLEWSRVSLGEAGEESLTVVADRETSEALFEALWAGEMEPTDAAISGFLDELINAVAGQVLARMAPDAAATIGLPVSGRGPLPPAQESRGYELEDAGRLAIVRSARG